MRLVRCGVVLAFLAGSLTVGAAPASAICVSPLRDGGFESQTTGTVSAPWIAEGRAGIDVRRGLSYMGANNAWARSNAGWNAVRQPVHLTAGVNYSLYVAVRSSANVRDGYLGIRDASQSPRAEVRFGAMTTYQVLRVNYTPSYTGTHNVFAGFWAPNQDAWIQVDAVSLTYPCDDNHANPV